MTVTKASKIKKFHDFDEAANHILQLLSLQTGMNSLFIAKNDGRTNWIIKSRNEGEELVPEGSSLPLEETFCGLSVNHGEEVLIIPDISADEQARSLKAAAGIGAGTFAGIPVYFENGEIYGTICALDTQTFNLTEQQISLFEMMSSLLTYVLELEKANKQIQSLSSPLVPVTRGVSILPIIGEITAKRAQAIIDEVMLKSGEDDIDFLVIDVSGVSQINSEVGNYLLKLVKLLKIVGITPVITGMQPFMAIRVPHFAEALKGVLIEANLETALKKLGFVLIKDCEKSRSDG